MATTIIFFFFNGNGQVVENIFSQKIIRNFSQMNFLRVPWIDFIIYGP